MRRFLTAKGLLGAALVIAMVLIAIVAPLVIPADYGTRMTMTARLRPPSELHWLGTDQLGRDLFYRVMLGARTSLGIAGAAVLMSLVLGLPIGMAAGFYRGGIDNALMRLVDTLLSFPVFAARADDQRHAWAQHPQRHHRHRRRFHAFSGADRARRSAPCDADALC